MPYSVHRDECKGEDSLDVKVEIKVKINSRSVPPCLCSPARLLTCLLAGPSAGDLDARGYESRNRYSSISKAVEY